MTRAQRKKIIERAIELVECGQQNFTCSALFSAVVEANYSYESAMNFRHGYCDFHMQPWPLWDDLEYEDEDVIAAQKRTRLMLLELFLIAG